MIDLKNFSVNDTVPSSIKSDKNVQSSIKAIDEQLKRICENIYKTLLAPRLDELSEEIIDELAWQYHIDPVYADLSIDKKRELIRSSISSHRIKGTPAAVEKTIATIFKSAKIEEWYEYGGEPYYFKISSIIEGIENKEILELLIDAVNATKNTRSWLEKISFLRNANAEVLIAMILGIESAIAIYPSIPLMTDFNASIYAGGAILQHRKVVIK